MSPDQMRRRLESAWTAFEDSYAGLGDAQLLVPGVTGHWSVREIIAHVTWGEEEALKHLPLLQAGGRPPRYSVQYGVIDAGNALMTDRTRSLSLGDVLRRHDEIHRALLDYVHAAPPELLATETRFRRRIRLDAYGHYPVHAAAIRRWRMSRGW